MSGRAVLDAFGALLLVAGVLALTFGLALCVVRDDTDGGGS